MIDLHIQPEMADDIDIRDKPVYYAASSNRNENNISCHGDFLLYSRCRSPILRNLKNDLVVAVLIGHTGEVNGQCFVLNDRSSDDETNTSSVHVISTGHDNRAIIWRARSQASLNDSIDPFEILHDISSPDDSVFTTRCSYLKDGHFFSALTTMDGNICMYRDDELIQTLPTKHCYFDAKFFQAAFNDSQNQIDFTFLALAGSDNKLHIFVVDNDLRLDHIQDLAGFNDWIKCLDFLALSSRPNEFLLATACQDSLIQVWLLKLTSSDIDERTQMRTKISNIGQSGVKLTSTLETVLSGHEGFVHSLCWFKSCCTNGSNKLQLVSCSSDKTVIVWQSSLSERTQDIASSNKKYEQSPASEGIWRELARFGETGEANLPFIGVCLSSNDERFLYAQSLRGAIHQWRTEGEDKTRWMPEESICGHFDSITDLAWERSGAYLLSSSNDKTCRLHAIASHDNRWHELARPQVHGYEINCLASLDFSKFASGAEEKTIRTFTATKFFVKNHKALAMNGHKTEVIYDNDCLPGVDEFPDHAQLPALGLSNRGSQYPFDFTEEHSSMNQQAGGDTQKRTLSDNNSWQEVGDLVKHLATIDHLESLPHEEILLQSTLWWEDNKLFGHSNELHALACDSRGRFLASASKANRSDLASFIIWETEKFRKVALIEHHSLTVTRLRFSPDDNYLLSVSRDRTWCLSKRNTAGRLRNAYHKIVGTVKSNAVHERIIWDCAWTHDSRYFITVSRDKKAILWSVDELERQLDQAAQTETTEQTSNLVSHQPAPSETPVLSYVSSKQFSFSIQTVDSTQVRLNVNNESSYYLFAFGFEDGSMELHSFATTGDDQNGRWQLLKTIRDLHQLSVRRLAFQPMRDRDEKEETNVLMLASGGDDCVVRLTRFDIRA